MSIDQARSFIERMKTDEQFRMKIMEEKDVIARIYKANHMGFDCTKEEIIALEQKVALQVDPRAVDEVSSKNCFCRTDGWSCVPLGCHHRR